MVSGFWNEAGDTLKSRVWRFFWHRGGPVGTLDWSLQATTFDPGAPFTFLDGSRMPCSYPLKESGTSKARKHAQTTTPNTPLHLVVHTPPSLLARTVSTKRCPVRQNVGHCVKKHIKPALNLCLHVHASRKTFQISEWSLHATGKSFDDSENNVCRPHDGVSTQDGVVV